MLSKQRKKYEKKFPKQSSVANVFLARIIVACGAVNLVLGHFINSYNIIVRRL